MRAVVCAAYGPPEVVRIEERLVPAPQPGSVRIRVGAAAVNFPDVLLVAGKYQISVPPPFIPGSEFAGVITELGDQVNGFAVGDRVTGTGLYGAFAEEITAPAGKLTRTVDGVDDRTAAAFGVAHRTAYHTLRSVARLRAGERLLVLGAGGGVGLAAVQLGALLGAEVTAVASSTEKLTTAASYGATRLVDHRTDDLRRELRSVLPDGADVVVDPVGGSVAEPALRALGRGGRYVTVGYASGTIPRIPLNLVLVKGIHLLGFQFQDVPASEFQRNEAELAELFTSGQVRPHIDSVVPLARTAEALRKVADGRAIGKIVIDVAA